MTRWKTVLPERAEELLVRRATEGLDDAETAELRALGEEADESFDLAAAALDLATLTEEPMPAELAERILGAAGASAPAIHSLPPLRRKRRGWVNQLGWVAAAASLLVAIGALWRRPPAPVAPPPKVVYLPAPAPPRRAPAEERADLLRDHRDAVTLPWKATADAAARGATGEVVWSPSAQRGFMRFVGLAKNDGTRAQYQLWIFDKARDARYPVDGGVFDVSASGEVIVPITARLHISQPTLFAVTVERPGGVVVSRRERIVMTASPAS